MDAETGEMHPQLSRGQRLHDLSIATENIAGELMDLQAGGYLSPTTTRSRRPRPCSRAMTSCGPS